MLPRDEKYVFLAHLFFQTLIGPCIIFSFPLKPSATLPPSSVSVDYLSINLTDKIQAKIFPRLSDPFYSLFKTIFIHAAVLT